MSLKTHPFEEKPTCFEGSLLKNGKNPQKDDCHKTTFSAYSYVIPKLCGYFFPLSSLSTTEHFIMFPNMILMCHTTSDINNAKAIEHPF